MRASSPQAKQQRIVFLSALMLLLLSASAAALIIDEAEMLDASLESQIENFNSNSPILLSVITTPESYDVTQQAAENFNTHQLQLLLFYSKAEDLAVVVQPPEEGIPAAAVQSMLNRYKDAYGQNLPLLISELMVHAGQWQKVERAVPQVCSLLKDGKCEKDCRGTDLDCLCGNDICEHFESAETCAKDCQQPHNLWCGMRKDGYCDAKCRSFDVDCEVKPALVGEKQRVPFTIFLVLGGILLFLLALIRISWHYRRNAP